MDWTIQESESKIKGVAPTGGKKRLQRSMNPPYEKGGEDKG